MISAFLAILCLMGLVGLAYAIGRLATRPVTDTLTYLERFIFVVPVGMGVVGLFVWVCGLLGWIKPVLFFFLLLSGGLGLVWMVYDRTQTMPRPDPLKLPVALLVTIAAVMNLLRLFTLVAALAPPSILEWDALSYHLANPKMWLMHGRIDFLPFDHHSNFPFIIQMLYLLMQGVGSVAGAKLVHWFCYVLLGFSVYTFAARHIRPLERGRVVGTVAGLILASTPIVLWESTVGYVDLATALYTWLALYALINAAESVTGENKQSLSWLLLSAVLMGFALGTKYTVLGFWGLLLIGVLGWNFAVTRRFAKETIPHAALWGIVSLAIGSVWYIKNWLVTGNPVYPFAYNIFGGKYWSAENAAQYAAEQARFGYGKTPLELLLSPFKVTYEVNYLPEYFQSTGRQFIYTEYISNGFGLSPVFVAVLFLLPFLKVRLSRPSIYCLLFGAGVYAFWFLVMQQTRYLIPALPALSIVAAEIVVLLWAETKGLVRYAASGLVAIMAVWGLYLAGGLAFYGVPGVFGGTAFPAWPVVSGQITREAYVAKTLGPLGEACFFINQNTEKTAKVAIFDETRGFYLDREYLWAQPDHAAGLIPYDSYSSVEAWLADFKQKGYTTLLLGLPPEKIPCDR